MAEIIIAIILHLSTLVGGVPSDQEKSDKEKQRIKIKLKHQLKPTEDQETGKMEESDSNKFLFH